MERGLFHSVTLNLDKCKGCTTCIKHCPTEAIRVRFGKAYIIEDRCIDCGQCIRVCPHRAKSAVCDSFEALKNYRCTVALPAPSLYGQFNNLTDIGLVLTGLLKIGFDRVYEVAAAAEYLSDFTRSELLKNRKLPHPTISSACPTCGTAAAGWNGARSWPPSCRAARAAASRGKRGSGWLCCSFLRPRRPSAGGTGAGCGAAA